LTTTALLENMLGFGVEFGHQNLALQGCFADRLSKIVTKCLL